MQPHVKTVKKQAMNATMNPIRKMLTLAGLFLVSTLCLGAAAAESTGPNILLILTDDIGWGDFRSYNSKSKIPTPNVDRLAQTGMRFTDAHTTSGACSPSRYSLLTGNYPWRGREAAGVWSYRGGSDLLPGQKTVGAMLRTAGYRTALFGKAGIGADFQTKPGKKSGSTEVDWSKPLKEGPREWGFDYSYVLLCGHQGPPYMFFENGRVDGDGDKVTTLRKLAYRGSEDTLRHIGPGLPDWDSSRVGEALVRKTEKFLDAHAASNKTEGHQRPFYIQLSTAGAHTPYTPPDAIMGAPVRGVSGMTPHTDMVVEADVVVGKLVELLDQRELLADTLIVVTSDNGGVCNERKYGHDAVAGLRGYKGLVWEGGNRVPLVVRWGNGKVPGSRIPPGTVRHQLVAIHDLVATFAELAGVKIEADQAMDSFSLAAVLVRNRGDDRPVRKTLIVQSAAGVAANLAEPVVNPSILRKASDIASDDMAHALREGAWALTLDTNQMAVALHNLTKDISQKQNLINDPSQAARINRMLRRYVEIRQSKRSSNIATNQVER